MFRGVHSAELDLGPPGQLEIQPQAMELIHAAGFGHVCRLGACVTKHVTFPQGWEIGRRLPFQNLLRLSKSGQEPDMECLSEKRVASQNLAPNLAGQFRLQKTLQVVAKFVSFYGISISTRGAAQKWCIKVQGYQNPKVKEEEGGSNTTLDYTLGAVHQKADMIHLLRVMLGAELYSGSKVVYGRVSDFAVEAAINWSSLDLNGSPFVDGKGRPWNLEVTFGVMWPYHESSALFTVLEAVSSV
ncbi:hypothetical protein NDU88_002045 [Pleurodeles waltl]|uniref:Uncharacterized protein n=1 Tax=Pleurodeles waltl TaxID=8319 RepID=A0AAV7TJJ8_PLEWA|nr:hypothetical protein NDU88_002045 [Pleurodeles waltl]